MEFRSGALGAIAAVTGTTGAIGFDLVHPVLAKDNGIGGTRAGLTVHGEVGKSVKLLEFGTFPEGPGVQVAEFASREGAECTFGGAAGSRGEGMKKEFQVIVGDRVGHGFGAEELGADRVDGTDLVDAKGEVFGVSPGFSVGKRFGGKSDGKGGDRVGADGGEGGVYFSRGVGSDVVDGDDEGAEVLAFGTAVTGAESRGEGAGADIGDVWATADGAAGDFESESRRGTGDVDRCLGEAQEGI
jgi:hypothetical protein